MTGASSIHVSMSVKPASASRAAVVSADAKCQCGANRSKLEQNAAESMSAWARACSLAMLGPPPHCARRRPPGRSARWIDAKSAGWSSTQWNVAVLKTTSADESIGRPGSAARTAANGRP